MGNTAWGQLSSTQNRAILDSCLQNVMSSNNALQMLSDTANLQPVRMYTQKHWT